MKSESLDNTEALNRTNKILAIVYEHLKVCDCNDFKNQIYQAVRPLFEEESDDKEEPL